MDLISLIQKLSFAPPIFEEDFISQLGEETVLPDATFSKLTYASKPAIANGTPIPQAIAHRGLTVKHPENTIVAFEAAVEAGAHAIETDVRLTKDGMVVLSHDPNLKRCYGVDRLIKDCTWAETTSMRTLREPHEPPGRFKDLLELFKLDQWRDVWMLVDIKVDHDPEELVKRVASLFREIDPGHDHRWRDKVALGYWAAKYIPLIATHLPAFAITHVSFSPYYSSKLFPVEATGFTVAQASTLSPLGRRFIRQAQREDRAVYVWTVNDEKGWDWCIRNGIEGVVTDDLRRYLEFCEGWSEEKRYEWGKGLWWWLVYFNVWIWVFAVAFWGRYGSCVKRREEGRRETREGKKAV